MTDKQNTERNDANLDEMLYAACLAETADYELIEDLLKKGADPMRIFNEYDDSVLDQLFCEAESEEFPFLDDRIPKLVSLFIKYGMDVNASQNLPEDDRTSPLWSMAFWCAPNAIKTLKILLDNGLKASELENFVDHFITDAAMVSGDIPGEEYQNYLICGFKMIMLSASYDEILSTSEYLRSVIGLGSIEGNNKEILPKFRQYDDYSYDIDKSTCTNLRFGINNATVTITEKESGRKVWKFVV